jgi:hypothetical protein
MHKKHVVMFTALTAATLCSSVVYAQEGKLNAAELDDIEQEGFDNFAAQNWAQAMVKWSEVLDQDPTRTHLLYFKAQAFLKSGDREASRRYALRARSATPPLKENLAKKNEELLGQIGQLDAKDAEHKREQMEMRRTNQQIAQDVRPRASGWIWVGTGALVLGGASLGGAVWQSNKLVDVREQMKPLQTRAQYDALAEEASGHQTLGKVFFISSLALMGTGVGLIIWDLMTPEDVDSDTPAAPAAGLGISPNGAFVRITW